MTDAPSSLESPTSKPEMAIEVTGLTKVYAASKGAPEKLALDNLNLAIPRGSILGLLGPNGAGKSTFINILAGLVLKTDGFAAICGHDLDDEPRLSRSSIGIVPQELNLDPFFTPRELLNQQASLYGVPRKKRRTDALLEMVELGDKGDMHTRAMSGGMRRRLMIAKAMVHTPSVLVLDEPTAGVDVELRHLLWRMIRNLNATGTTIILATHYLEEAEQLCSRIAIMKNGELIAHDTKENLLSRLDSKELILTLQRELPALPENLEKFGWQLTAPNTIRLAYRPSQTKLGQILLNVQAYGYGILDITTKEADLESLFLQLTKIDEKDQKSA